jgi:hypothetical protein
MGCDGSRVGIPDPSSPGTTRARVSRPASRRAGSLQPGWLGRRAGSSQPGWPGRRVGSSQPGWLGRRAGSSQPGWPGRRAGSSQPGWPGRRAGPKAPTACCWSVRVKSLPATPRSRFAGWTNENAGFSGLTNEEVEFSGWTNEEVEFSGWTNEEAGFSGWTNENEDNRSPGPAIFALLAMRLGGCRTRRDHWFLKYSSLKKYKKF